MFKEFKAFAFKGNLMDMAVGIMIGGAFSTVVKSLVDDVFMPLIGRIVPGNLDFSERWFDLAGKAASGLSLEKAREVEGAIILAWGSFVTNFISFLLLALIVFLVIKKFIGALQKEEEKPAEPPKPSEEVLLLTEIRDALKGAKSEKNE